MPKSRKVRVGDRVEFACEEKESGNPIESTTWYKDGVKLNQKRHMIESAQKSDKGRYTCEVKNDVGENDRFTVTLTVGKNLRCFKVTYRFIFERFEKIPKKRVRCFCR